MGIFFRYGLLFFLTIAWPLQVVFSQSLKSSKAPKFLGHSYFNRVFGHLHPNASSTSTGVAIVSCGQRIATYWRPLVSQESEWQWVDVSGQKGYLRKDFLSKEPPPCLQKKYPQFFQSLPLDLTQLYYWARLYDQYTMARTRVSE